VDPRKLEEAARLIEHARRLLAGARGDEMGRVVNLLRVAERSLLDRIRASETGEITAVRAARAAQAARVATSRPRSRSRGPGRDDSK
jgi:hypothetical protein